MLAKKEGDPWIRSLSVLLMLLVLTMAAKPAEAWLYQDPTPRVVEKNLPVANNTQTVNTVYIVKRGDTLLEIAKKFQVNMEQLAALNKVTNPNLISVGQMLTIPAVGAGDPHPIVYQIKSGDTLWDIAKLYNTEIETIIAANQLKNPNRLAVGEQLVILVGNSVPATGTNLTPVVKSVASFIWPVQGTITSKFGMRWGEFHYGLDIAADMGTSVKAAAGGVVVAADWRGTYGKAVIIQHNETYTTLYAHNSDFLVKEGDLVSQGQVIARVGSTGRSTGPHLHFEVHENDKAMNPLKFLNTR